MPEKMIRVFVGYDPVESVAWHTMVHSILEKSSVPLAITPINLNNLKGIYKRTHDSKQSNQFSFTRFLVPYLCGYSGYAVFFDCDMLLRADIASLFAESSIDSHAVCVVKHDYIPKNKIKYLNNIQHAYPRKNWSSVVLWNCGHPANKIVTPDYVNTVEPSILHRFSWLQDDEIGELDIRWNWLVGEYENPPIDVKNIHWTVGGPYFNEYKNTDFSDEWYAQLGKVIYCKQRDE